MLKEIPQVKQIPGEARRRWFLDDDFDLVLWFDAQEKLLGFQLTYDKRQQPHALTWHTERGFQHDSVDDGEQRPGRYKGSPILFIDGAFHGQRVAHDFRQAASQIGHQLVDDIIKKLLSFNG